jgi:prepilin-type N-terminal cleavage/methylation domain-containing protein
VSLRGEDGYTITELLVAMTVGVIVVTAAFALLGQAFPLSATTRARVESTQRGRVALDQTLTLLRSQVCINGIRPPVTVAKDNEVVFTMNLGNESAAPEQRRLVFSGGVLKEEVYPATTGGPRDWQFATTPSRTRAVAHGLARQGTTPFFRFYAFTTSSPASPDRLLNPGTAGLAADDLESIVRVDVTFESQPPKDGARAAKVPFQGSALVRTADALTPNAGPGCA